MQQNVQAAEVPVSLDQTKWPVPPVDLGSVGRTLLSADAPVSGEFSTRAGLLSLKNSIYNFLTDKPSLLILFIQSIFCTYSRLGQTSEKLTFGTAGRTFYRQLVLFGSVR